MEEPKSQDQEEKKSSKMKEEVKSKEKPRSPLVEEQERWRREVVATRKWQELEPRTVRTVWAFEARDETELPFEPGALITGVRPASWVQNDNKMGY